VILVVSSLRDEHATAVLQHLAQLGAPARLLDLARFPKELRLSLEYGAEDHYNAQLELPPDGTCNLDDIRSVWWRRPQPFEIDPVIRRPSHRMFAYNESHEAFAGFWLTLKAHYVNHPTSTETAARKPYQLRVAQAVGLTIPRTLITNDPAKARSFVANQQGRTVYKSFSATEYEWRETRLLRREEVAALDNVAYAPLILQEYVPAGVDLRVTVIGDTIFAAAIHSQDTSYPVDFRMDMSRARVEPAMLPPDVESGLLTLMARLGLVYGAIDMRRTPDGRHIFLEINPAGQWLFIEQRTDQPITATLARYLALDLPESRL
jgi:glutathione synthase/RimK-type ligase-like ATP-grasp enzyme